MSSQVVEGTEPLLMTPVKVHKKNRKRVKSMIENELSNSKASTGEKSHKTPQFVSTKFSRQIHKISIGLSPDTEY